ncbi:MAG TPA: TetR/AcrR family transcriptional regulator, partial [Kineosporiaceae bacterium]|nr:TetR/AcrR family transcriptional regulator [Kineosporiaceae bacterium]
PKPASGPEERGASWEHREMVAARSPFGSRSAAGSASAGGTSTGGTSTGSTSAGSTSAGNSSAGDNSVGRPRLAPRRRKGLTAREEILDAAAQLFSEQGYAATSTRAIAMSVGIKQASLYYHFSSKEQILAELLVTTVVPSLEVAAVLADSPDPIEARLWALAAFDVRLLCSGRWNIGALYLLPELRLPNLAPFYTQRRRLRGAYGAMITDGIAQGSFTVENGAVATDLVFGLIESVVLVRQDRGDLDPDLLGEAVADGCLRLLSASGRHLVAARRRGTALLAEL